MSPEGGRPTLDSPPSLELKEGRRPTDLERNGDRRHWREEGRLLPLEPCRRTEEEVAAGTPSRRRGRSWSAEVGAVAWRGKDIAAARKELTPPLECCRRTEEGGELRRRCWRRMEVPPPLPTPDLEGATAAAGTGRRRRRPIWSEEGVAAAIADAELERGSGDAVAVEGAAAAGPGSGQGAEMRSPWKELTGRGDAAAGARKEWPLQEDAAGSVAVGRRKGGRRRHWCCWIRSPVGGDEGDRRARKEIAATAAEAREGTATAAVAVGQKRGATAGARRRCYWREDVAGVGVREERQ